MTRRRFPLRISPRILVVCLLAVGLVVPTGAFALSVADPAVPDDDGSAPAVAAPAADAEAGPRTGSAPVVREAPARNGSNASVGVGQQLATVVSVAGDDVQTGVEGTSFAAAFDRADDGERAELVVDRARELADSAAAVREAYRNATRAYREGAIDESAYAQRLAILNSRADNLARSVERLRAHARNLSTLELRAAGYDPAVVRSATRDLQAVTGAGHRAIRLRFTGERSGQLDIETDDTSLTITVAEEDGERSREFEATRDSDPNLTVNQSAALATARAALADTDGRWILSRSRVHGDEGYYAFEFELRDENTTGEAEVSVDGSTGEVFSLEAEIEPIDDPDEDDGGEDGDEDDGNETDGDGDDDEGETELALVVAGGTPGPGETVTVRALAGGDPVANATVTLNGDPVGTTGRDGTLRVTLPQEGAKVTAEYGGAEAELEFEFDSGTEDPTLGNLAVDATYEAGTVSLRVTYNGTGVGGVAVEANGEAVGTTGADGALSFGVGDADELDLELTKGEFETERRFVIRNGSIVPEELADDSDSDDSDSDDSDSDDSDSDDSDSDDSDSDDSDSDDSDSDDSDSDDSDSDDSDSGDSDSDDSDSDDSDSDDSDSGDSDSGDSDSGDSDSGDSDSDDSDSGDGS